MRRTSTTDTSRISQSPHDGLGQPRAPSYSPGYVPAAFPLISTKLKSFWSWSHCPVNFPTPPFQPTRWSSLTMSLPSSGEHQADVGGRRAIVDEGTKV